MKFKSSEPWSAKICGRVNALEVDLDDDDGVENNIAEDNDKPVKNSFVDHRGLVEVKLHLGNKSLELGEELSFEIVFTAFQGIKIFEFINKLFLIYYLKLVYIIFFYSCHSL